MNCEQFEQALNAELDNLATVQEKEDMTAHVAECRNCRNTSYWYKRVKVASDLQEEIEVPANFTTSVMAKIDALPAHGQKSFLKFWKVGLSIAVSAAAGLFLYIQPGHSGQQLASDRPLSEAVNPAPAVLAAGSGKVSLVARNGEVEILRANGFRWETAVPNQKVAYNDKIRTMGTSEVALVYEDGVELKMKPNSLVQIQEHGVRVFHGNTWVNVTRKGRHFEARTPNLVASVRGTMYDVEVKLSQKPVDTALADLSQRRELLMKSVSPEVYFRDFSLEALASLSAGSPYQDVDSKVRVFESSVYVAPLDVNGFEEDRGTVLAEGSFVVVNSQNWHEALKVSSLGGSDYKSWDLPLPAALAASDKEQTTAATDTKEPVTGKRSPGAQPTEVLPSKSETAPSESFETITGNK